MSEIPMVLQLYSMKKCLFPQIPFFYFYFEVNEDRSTVIQLSSDDDTVNLIFILLNFLVLFC